MEYSYVISRGELHCELKKLDDLQSSSVVTHLVCERPEREGFQERIKKILKMPEEAIHPLLD
jgi:hypothetical protein